MIQKMLNKNWKFLLDDPLRADRHSYWDKGHDDRSWKAVTLPHDWSVEYPFSQDYSSGTGYVTGGIVWYRLRFSLPEEVRGKKLFLHFDGVYKNSQVWVNSYYLGKRPNGYVSFSYDISEQACFGEQENVVAVKVSHTDLADSRWFTGSGIYRKVYLSIQDEVYLENDSLFFQAKEVNRKSALLEIQATISNDSDHEEEVILRHELKDAELRVVMQKEYTLILKAKESRMNVLQETLEKPKLWSDREANLYQLTTTLVYQQEERVVDQRKVGIRKITFDPNKGFFINDENRKLKGVCVHHDAGALGAAVTANVWKRRLEKLKAMGCNALRCSHNPHMPELYELCDEMGFYVIDEAFDEWEGPKNKWSTGHNVYPPLHQGYYEEFPQWHEKDLKAMVLRDRNYPSVILWSIGNEIDYPNDPYCHPMFDTMTGNNDANKPAAERMYNPNKPNAERLSVIAKQLVKQVKEVDESRPVTLAAAYPEMSTYLGFIDELDVVGYNYKEEFYEQDHQRFPEKPFMGSENGHGYGQWLAVKNNDYISGQFLWTGIDYLGEAHGWPIRGSGAGLITTAGFEKAHYYYRQSLWAEEAMVKVLVSRDFSDGLFKELSSSWTGTPGEKLSLRIFTNCEEVEIFLNGGKISRKNYDEQKGFIDVEVEYHPGILRVVGYKNGGHGAEESLETTGAAARIRLSAYDAKVCADGESIIQIEGEILDAQGLLCTQDASKIYVEVEGEAQFVAMDNGDLSDTTIYTSKQRHAYQGRFIIYLRSTQTQGKVKVTCRSNGLQAGSVEVETK